MIIAPKNCYVNQFVGKAYITAKIIDGAKYHTLHCTMTVDLLRLIQTTLAQNFTLYVYSVMLLLYHKHEKYII